MRDPQRLALDRHQVRRLDRIPTTTLLVGPYGAASACWRNWLVAQGRAMLTIRGADPRALARRFLDLMSSHRRTAPAIDALAQLPPVDGIAGAFDLLPHTTRPGLLILAPREETLAWLRRVGPFLSALTAARPREPIALVIEAGPAAQLESLPRRGWVDQLREGTLAVAGVAEDALEAKLTRALGEESTARYAGSIRSLVADGASPEVAAAFVAAARAAADPAESGKARSKAEAFLFRWLEEIPELQGQFELNGKLSCEDQMLEVDLLARRLRVAIELDGVFHFTGPDTYRRDRRKDLLLQRGGFLVMRFLSDDIVSDFAEIRRVLREVLLDRGGGE